MTIGCGVFALAVGLVLGLFLGVTQTVRDWRAYTVEKGAAEYNSQTGEWQWKEPILTAEEE